MRLAVGSDHAGFQLKQKLIEKIERWGHQVTDLGTDSDTVPADYPDLALAVGTAVLQERADRGIVICGSGVGASIAVNKLPGVRGGLCHDLYSARQGVEHDDMNVLVLGARVVGADRAVELVGAFLAAVFSKEERHVKRLAKIKAIEERYAGGGFQGV